MNVNLKEKIAQIYARKGTREAPARWRIPLLFLALLIPALAGQLAPAQDQPGPDYALIIDVYSGAVPPDATQEKAFWLWLETLNKTEEPGGLPKVIHIERVLSENDVDFAGEVLAGDRVRVGHDLGGSAFGHDLATVFAGSGAEVENVVGMADSFLIVFDDEDRVAEVAQGFERGDEALIVALVEANAGLIEHIQHAAQS